MESVGYEVLVNGEKVAEDTDKGRDGWWNMASDKISRSDSVPLLNKAETPFSNMWWDRYAEVSDVAPDNREPLSGFAPDSSPRQPPALTAHSLIFPRTMADTQTTVALNIGSQRISMAVFEVSKTGGLVLKAYDSESIVADPSMDASRIAQTRVAIADLVQRLKVGKTKARYAISGQAVFTRFVKLPPLQDDNIEQLVTFEAQQHVPFPLAGGRLGLRTHRGCRRKRGGHRRHQGGRAR